MYIVIYNFEFTFIKLQKCPLLDQNSVPHPLMPRAWNIYLQASPAHGHPILTLSNCCQIATTSSSMRLFDHLLGCGEVSGASVLLCYGYKNRMPSTIKRQECAPRTRPLPEFRPSLLNSSAHHVPHLPEGLGLAASLFFLHPWRLIELSPSANPHLVQLPEDYAFAATYKISQRDQLVYGETHLWDWCELPRWSVWLPWPPAISSTEQVDTGASTSSETPVSNPQNCSHWWQISMKYTTLPGPRKILLLDNKPDPGGVYALQKIGHTQTHTVPAYWIPGLPGWEASYTRLSWLWHPVPICVDARRDKTAGDS